LESDIDEKGKTKPIRSDFYSSWPTDRWAICVNLQELTDWPAIQNPRDPQQTGNAGKTGWLK